MIARSITIRITGRAVSILLAALALVWLVAGFSKILFILFLAILLAVGIDPLVDRMERWKLPRALAIFIVYLAILAVLVAAVALLVPVLVEESSQLADSLPKAAQQLGDQFGNGSIGIPGVGHISTAEMGRRMGGEIGSVVASV